jgi:RNA polymerase sigma factor (sigma-70 family)
MASVARTELPVEPDEEEKLVVLARRGDRAAAASLLTAHELVVFRVCQHLLPAGEDVEAAVQETFVRALRGLARYSGKGSFAGWITTIAVNLCRDRLRRRRVLSFRPLESGDDDEADPIAVLASPGADPEREVMGREAVRAVRREFRALPRRQREVFALRFYAELDLEGIAAVLGIDVGSVKTHLHRAVRRVRERVEEARP